MKKSMILGLVLLLALSLGAFAEADTTAVTCTVTGVRSITAPGAQTLSCGRGGTDEETGLSLGFSTDFTDDIMVIAANSSGTEAAGVKLSIKGADIATYAAGVLYTGSEYASAFELDDSISTAITDICFQLDATGATAGATGLSADWVATVTFTIQAHT